MRRAQTDLNSQAIRNLAYNPSFEAAGISTILRTNLAQNPSLETAGAAVATRTNIFTNPSAETASATVNTRTNLALNPSFEASSGTVNVRTNLATNPSMEATSATVTTRTNLATNPSFETASGTVNVRTNLALDPSATATGQWGNIGSTTYTKATDTAVSHEGATAARFTLTASGALGGKGLISGGITSGETVSWSIWVYPSVACSFQPYWERSTPTYAGGNGGALVTCPANTWTKITGTVTFGSTQADPAGAFGFGFYNGANAFVANDFFVADELIVEKTPVSALSEFFTGASAAAGDFTYIWNGTANASTSIQRGTGLSGVGSANQATVHRTGSAGAYEAKITYNGSTIADSGMSFVGNFTPAASKTYTVSVDLTSDINRAVKFSAQGTGVVNQNSSNISLTGNVKTRQSWSFTTTSTAPTSVALYILRADLLLGTLNVNNMLIEEGTTVHPYFDGATTYTNLCNNPSVETDLTGWAVKGSTAPTIARDTTISRVGSASVKITQTATVVQGVGFTATGLVIGQQYTMSAYVYIPTGSIDVISTVANIGYGTDTAGLRDQWVRPVMTFTATATTHNAGFDTQGLAQVGKIFYVDGLVIERGNVASPYFEGTGDFAYVWAGTANFSVSYQQAPDVVTWAPALASVKSVRATSIKSHGTAAMMIVNGPDGNRTTQTTLAASVGKIYTMSADMQHNAGVNRELRFDYTFQDSGGTRIGNYNAGPTVLVAGGSWGRRSTTTIAAPTNTATITVYAAIIGATALETFWVDAFLIEESALTQAYFDGSTSATTDFTHVWSVGANNSVSYQQAPGVENWSNRWFSNTGGSGVLYKSNSTGLSGACARKLWVTANTGAAADTGITSPLTAVTAGAVYTLSAYVRSSVSQAFTPYIVWKDAADVTISNTSTATNTLVSAGVWTRVSVTATAPANTVNAYFIVGPYGGALPMPAGSYLEFDNFLIEPAAGVLDYFDGANPIQNLFPNPSITTDTTGYNNAGGTISTRSRDTTTYYHGPASLKVSWVASGTGLVETAISGATSAPAGGGKTYTSSAYMKLSSGATRDVSIYMNFFTSTGTYISNASGTVISATLNSWIRPFVTALAPANTSYISVGYRFGSVTATDIFHVDSLLVEESSTVRPFYEGTGDFTYAWAGTANASVSYQQAPGATGVGFVSSLGYAYQSKTVGITSGTKSIRISPTNVSNGDSFAELNSMLGSYIFKASTVYTLSGNRTILAPQTNIGGTTHFRVNVGGELTPTLVASVANVAGTQRVVARFTTGASTALGFVRLYNGSYFGGGDVWWDDIVLEEGITNGSYFDGANPIQNLITNPSFEVNTTGWTSYLSTISRDTTEAHIGSASLKVVTTGQGGPSLNPTLPVTAATTYTQSAWVKAPSGQAMTMQMLQYSPTVVNLKSTSVAFTGTGAWQRVSLTDTIALGATLMTPYIFSGASGITFWVDAVMVERSAVLNPYYEGLGDFTYAWTGTANASSSEQRGFLVSDRQNVSANSVVYHSSVRTMTGAKSGAIRTRADVLDNGTLMYPVSEYMVDSGTIRLTPNVAHTWSMYVWVPSGSGTVRLQDISSGVVGTPNTLFDQWDRISVTFTAPATGGSFLRMRANTTVPAGTVIFWDNELLEVASTIRPYFDGSTTGTDFTYEWTGTANASTSNHRGTYITDAFNQGASFCVQSSDWFTSGTKSVRVITTAAGEPEVGLNTSRMVFGKTYTILAKLRINKVAVGSTSRARRINLYHSNNNQQSFFTQVGTTSPNAVGVYDHRLTVTIPADTTHIYLRLGGHSSVAFDADAYWDDLMIVEGTYAGDYMDGTKPFSKWDGTVNSAVSIGYPPQLFDLAGKPTTDVGPDSTSASNTVDGFSARTFYVVYESTDFNDGSWQVPFSYGFNASSDGYTLQSNAAGSQQMVPRADFATGGGNVNNTLLVPDSRSNRVHVMALAFPQGLTGASVCVNGGADVTDIYSPGTVGWTTGKVVTYTRTGIKGVRALVYYAEHDRATRLAISRYLGNKYGASVA